MKYIRDKQGFLCYVNNDGKTTGRVPDDKPDKNKFMFGVDSEFDDDWEDNSKTHVPWTE